eukprot:TRINITY_DN4638_c0_g1_i1.p1 TRINITY_DN4638_c0_g1~~TRINITY_DN4638_c0_g1_i1.p1  ORF type:complete len:134 (+),score=27.09 TRINITY_DN4638_c0_g1_i1:413-814(+)
MFGPTLLEINADEGKKQQVCEDSELSQMQSESALEKYEKVKGITPRCADLLMQGIEEMEDLDEATVKVSVLEIYNENIKDILNPSEKHLQIRMCPGGEGVEVKGLSGEYANSGDEIMSLITEAMGNRRWPKQL